MQDVNTALGGSNGGTAQEEVCVESQERGVCVCVPGLLLEMDTKQGYFVQSLD